MFGRIVQLYKDAYIGLPRKAWILASSDFINRSGFMVLFFLNIYLTKQMGLSLSQAGQVMSAFGIGSLAGSYLGGWLIGHIGAFRIIKLSLALSGGFLIMAGYATTFPALFVLILLHGLTSAALFPANDTAISQFCTGELRSKGYALRRLASNLGVTIGPIVGGYLILISYKALFWVDGLTSIAAAFYVHTCLKQEIEIKTAQAKDKVKAASPWRDTYFLVFLFLFLILMTAFAQFLSTFPLYLYSVYQIPVNHIGALLAINTIIIVLFEMVLLHSLRKQSPMRMIILGAILIGAGYALLPFGRGFLYAGFTVVVWTFGEILVLPLSTTAVANRAGASIGMYMGLYSLVHSMALLIAPVIGNGVYSAYGGDLLFMSIGLVGLVCSTGLFLLRKKFTGTASPAAPPEGVAPAH
jgi:MFS family permease